MTMLMLLAAVQAPALPMPSPVAPVVIAPSPTVTVSAPAIVTLPQDMPVELMAMVEVNTDDAKPGTIFKLRVNRPVEIGGRVVVPVGTQAFGQVLTATDAGGLGKSGRMTATLLHLRLGDVEVPLEGQTSAKGTGSGSTAVAVLFSGVMGLFHRGNNAKIKAGEILNGYVAQDVALDLSGAVARRVEPAAAVPPMMPVPSSIPAGPDPIPAPATAR